MGLINRINRMAAQGRRAEEALYAMAGEEVANGNIKPGLWAKAFAEADGQEARAQAAYLKLRVQQMRDELAGLDRAMRRLDKEWGHTESPDHDDEPIPTTRDSPAQGQHTTSTASDPVTTLDDTALESLAKSRSSGGLALVIVASVLSLLSIAIVLENGPGSSSSSTGFQPPRVATDAATEVRRLIAEGRPWDAYELANKSSSQLLRDEAWAAIQQSASATGAASSPEDKTFTPTEMHAVIPEGTKTVETVAGRLSYFDPDEWLGQQYLTLNGEALDLINDHFSFVSITRHRSQDIVLVATQCAGSGCGSLDLAFIRLYPDRTAALETTDTFRFPSDFLDRLKEGVSVRDANTEVTLGLKDGVYWFASIGPTDKLAMSAVSARIEPLTKEDCNLAAEMLDYCAELKRPCEDTDFRDFPSSCPDATMPLYRATNYLARHTTGLNLPAFAHACRSASELSMAPSTAFIESEVCSGADPAQWSAADDPQSAVRPSNPINATSVAGSGSPETTALD